MKAGEGGLWLVIYMTHNQQRAQDVERMLLAEGFLVRVRVQSGAGAYELCVLESEAWEARKLLVEKGI